MAKIRASLIIPQPDASLLESPQSGASRPQATSGLAHLRHAQPQTFRPQYPPKQTWETPVALMSAPKSSERALPAPEDIRWLRQRAEEFDHIQKQDDQELLKRIEQTHRAAKKTSGSV